jgi:hypothetical protein
MRRIFPADGCDGEAAARGATGSAHWETTHPSRYRGK